jgi:hypothetical protein
MAAALVSCATTPTPRQEPAAPKQETKTDPTAAALAFLDQPAWSRLLAVCPADAFPGTNQAVKYLADGCNPELGGCLDRCQERDANACYAAALRAQELKAPEKYSETLFMRACELGIASGCTNRAAGMAGVEGEAAATWKCPNRTFEAMCKRDDPWACTMWGGSLWYGRGVKQDVRAARKILPKACSYAEDDPACVGARELLKEIAAAGKKSW